MPRIAELLLPAIRWDPSRGFDGERTAIEHALALGVGGFVLFGGPEAEVRALIKTLRQGSRVPLLIGAEMERGAGQQFGGATGLPPLAALAELHDANVITRAAKLTAREARTIGVNWSLAPSCDLDLRPERLLTGGRAIGTEPQVVGRVAATWIEACQHEGVLACARHFPGYGRVDPVGLARPGGHAVPAVDVPRSTLFDVDFAPFRSAIASRVASVMMAHARYPTLDASELPATCSTQIMRYLLRERLGFEGLILSDVLARAGLAGWEDEAELAIRAIDAGCDLLLCPRDLDGVIRALDAAVRDGPLYEDRIEQSQRRRLKWAQWAAPPTDYRKVSAADLTWAAQLAERAVRMVRGERPRLNGAVDVLVADAPDGANASWIAPFLDALRSAGVAPRLVDGIGQPERVLLVVVGAGRQGWDQLCDRDAPGRAAASLPALGTTVLVCFVPPHRLTEVPGTLPIVSGWTPDAAMQEASARWLARGG